MSLVDTLDSVAREMDAVTLLIGSAADSPCYGVADLAPGLHAIMRRWTDTLDSIAASAGDSETFDLETFVVSLTPAEGAAVRARAAAHAVTPETEILVMLDAAIRRHQANERTS